MNDDIDMLSYKAESAGRKVIDRDILNRARFLEQRRCNGREEYRSTIRT
jgi:hypothetical protein